MALCARFRASGARKQVGYPIVGGGRRNCQTRGDVVSSLLCQTRQGLPSFGRKRLPGALSWGLRRNFLQMRKNGTSRCCHGESRGSKWTNCPVSSVAVGFAVGGRPVALSRPALWKFRGPAAADRRSAAALFRGMASRVQETTDRRAVLQQRQAKPAAGHAPLPERAEGEAARGDVHPRLPSHGTGAPEGRRLLPHEAHEDQVAAVRERQAPGRKGR